LYWNNKLIKSKTKWKKIEKVRKLLRILQKMHRNEIQVDWYLYIVYGLRKIYITSEKKEKLEEVIKDLKLFQELLDLQNFYIGDKHNKTFENKRVNQAYYHKHYYIILKF